MYVPDNLDAFKAYQRKRDLEAEERPHCGICDEPIFDDLAFYIDGEWYHTDCYEDEFLKIIV